MPSLGLASPLATVVLVAPALVFAALGLMSDAPGEWGRGALLAWSSLVAALLAGTGLEVAWGPLPWAVLILGLAAIMIGGPPGLAVAALALLLLLVPGNAPLAPRLLPLGLAALPALVAIRAWVAG